MNDRGTLSPFDEELILLLTSGFHTSAEAGNAMLSTVQAIGSEIWADKKLKEPERRRVAYALRDIEPAYGAFVHFISSMPIDGNTKERLHFRLVKLLDDVSALGRASRLSKHGVRLGQTLQANIANETKVGRAAIKNSALRAALIEEALGMGEALVDSLEFARRIEPKVRRSLQVTSNAKGYTPHTLRRQIQIILRERSD